MKPSGVSPPRTRCLLVSPATKFGSWAWLDKLIRASGDDVEWLVVSYGKPQDPPANAKFVALPETNYAHIARKLSLRPFLGLNALYYVPLLLLAWAASLRFRPHVAVGNGVVSTMIVSPFRVRRCRVLLAFHGYLGHVGQPWRTMLRAGLKGTDRAFVNSAGSAHDLAAFLPPNRITTVLHWADQRFFATPLERNSSDRLRMLFVGRLDGEKFAQCLRVCTTLRDEGIVELHAVGGGELADQVSGEAMKRFGYIADIAELAAIYAGADVVWAPADTTYVSLPGIEALASGCPLIVSDVPAVDMRATTGARVPRDLVPTAVGTVVDGLDDSEALSTIRRLATDGISLETRSACREYARRLHSPANLQLVLDELRPRD